MELIGTIEFIGQTEQVSQSFSKRDIVVVINEETQYPQPISAQFTQDKCNLLDAYQVGQKVKVSTNLRGNKYADKNTGQTRYFNTIQGWKIEAVAQQQQQAPQQQFQQGNFQQQQQFQQNNNFQGGSANQDLPF